MIPFGCTWSEGLVKKKFFLNCVTSRKEKERALAIKIATTCMAGKNEVFLTCWNDIKILHASLIQVQPEYTDLNEHERPL